MTAPAPAFPDAAPAPARRRLPAWTVEGAGWVGALAWALVVVGHAAAVNDALLFTDGDSVLPALVAHSLATGAAQSWALSPVLFIPEMAVYLPLDALGLGVRGTLALNAIVNLLALYGALRLLVRAGRSRTTAVAGALLAMSAFGVTALLENAERGGFVFATLLATTTYYSATVIGGLLTVGLVARLLHPDRRHPLVLTVMLAGIVALSMLTNPLFAGWITAPVLAVLALLALTRRLAWRSALGVGLVVGGASAVGYLARIPFSDLIVADSGNYLRQDRWRASIGFYAGLLRDTAGSATGLAWLVWSAVIVVGAVVVWRGTWRRRDTGRTFVATVALASPVATSIGAIVLGTDAARYLQPWLYLPLAALVLAPDLLAARTDPAAHPAPGARALRVRAVGLRAAVVGLVALLVGGALSVPRLVGDLTTVDADLTCVVDWVDASGRTGAGQFWVVRGPKAYIADPARLVQVDHALNAYDWLVNQTDAAVGSVTFLVESDRQTPWALPAEVAEVTPTVVTCGRYRILDYGTTEIPIGPAHH